MADKEFIYGYALFDKNLYCGYVNDDLGAFFGKYAKQNILEMIHPEDLDRVKERLDTLLSGKEKETMTYARFRTATDDYRYLRALFSVYRDGIYNMGIIEVENAMSGYIEDFETVQRLRFLFEKQKEILFLYDYKTGEFDIFRYENGNRVSVKDDPAYCTIYEEMYGDIKHPSPDAVCFSFEKIYDVCGSRYIAKGNDIVKNAEKSVLVGVLKPVDNDAFFMANTGDTDDAMTGIFNKPYSLGLAREALKGHEKVSIVIMDVDDFKGINDTYGHLFGDEVIKKLALILQEAVEGRGFAGRFGGDEFFLCMYEIESEEELRNILQGIYYHFKNAFPDRERMFSLTMGIAEFPRNGENFDVLMKKADRALYIGKFKGKNRYIIYKEHIHGELPETETEETNILKEESSNRINQLKICKENMLTVMSAVKTGRDRNEVMNEIFGRVVGAYRVEGINIYAGENFENVFSFGRLTYPMKSTPYIKRPEVLEQFDDLGIFHTAVRYVRDKYLECFHGYMARHGILTSTQVLVGTKDNVKALFTYDTERDIGSCSKEEVRDLMMLSNIVGEFLL